MLKPQTHLLERLAELVLTPVGAFRGGVRDTIAYTLDTVSGSSFHDLSIACGQQLSAEGVGVLGSSELDVRRLHDNGKCSCMVLEYVLVPECMTGVP